MGTYNYNNSSCTDSSVIITVSSNSTFTNTPSSYMFLYTPPPPRMLIVPLPKKWSKSRRLAWVKFVNEETKTGWKVIMIITGTIEIIDPNIERRSMKEFLDIMRWNACDEDRKKIDRFTRSNGIK